MTITNKTPSVQAYRLLIYQRALHPELFRVARRRVYNHTEHETEVWLTPGGHVVRFQAGGKTVIEAVADDEQAMPQNGLIDAVPCLGERDLDLVTDPGLRYVGSLQSEQLSDNLFAASLAEMRQFAADNGATYLEWTGPDGSANLSIVDIQPFRREVHAQAYHLIGSAGFILRTQSIYELT